MNTAVSRLAVVGVMLASIGACGRTDNAAEQTAAPALTAATLGTQVVLATEDYLSSPEFANANVEYGERLVLQCRACHTLEEGGPNIIGPNLFGFFGRHVGSVAGFPYSRALSEADFVWTPRALDAWLAAPGEFLRGSSMAYPGLPRDEDRTDLIAALLTLTTE